MSDRGYINLIRHLTRTTSTLPLETLQASIAHYLARPPAPVPGSPTPLAATILGSPLFRPYTYQKLTALSVAFRHAVHLRFTVHKEEAEKNPGGLVSRGVDVTRRLGKWTRAVLGGFGGSVAVVRLACASGLLLGLQDWETELEVKKKEARVRVKVEEEVVLAFAEVMDGYATEGSEWETDFQRTVEVNAEAEDLSSIAVLLAAQCASFIGPQRLQALPLPPIKAIIDTLMTTIHRSFNGGSFLAPIHPWVGTNADGKVSMHADGTFAQIIRTIAGSTSIGMMASIAKFTALSLTVLVESRRAYGWDAISRTLDRLKLITSTVEADWARCPLAGVQDDADFVDSDSREVATTTWSILKTLLFTTLMLSQSILSAVVFIPDPQSNTAYSSPSGISSPYGIALDVLHVLSHLSFVMPQFGGVASTSDSGLPELKRAFYLALDVLSASETEADHFVEELCHDEGTSEKGKGVDAPRGLSNARKSFALACAEQLVPVISEGIIQSRVYPLCLPHLWDPSHRETYESAHSVMLAIFASYAQNSGTKRQQSLGLGSAFAEKIVPMYARCLVENSTDDRLSVVQLCMAYAALVRSASSFGYANAAPGDTYEEGTTQADTMAWFCIEVLLDAIRHVGVAPVKATLPYSSAPKAEASSSTSAASESTQILSEHLHRLHLALISSVPSVPLTLLQRLLTELKAIILSVPLSSSERGVDRRAEEMRGELVEALFKAISQDVGDAEKEFAIEWWYENLQVLARAETPSRHPVFDGAEATAAPIRASDVLSRL
ncbi:hypothetical protein GSI_15085 [Ganoderma sinense ZZ0214-1]|uniref:Uncharacterized protein n=1 Tax=Ganoderma sinense ZZ0214-1 TaxID=1077348 RepID=A0A2G8RLJ9_9APHY|nr:hypothetical protein GSI_15085 [Ganoderma sinense ZZ0214-1]